MIPSFFHTLRSFLNEDGALILPELELVLFALGILVIDRWLTAKEKHWNAILALIGSAFSGYTLFVQQREIQALVAEIPGPPWLLGFKKSVLVDPFFLFFAALLLATMVLVILFSARYLELAEEQSGVYYALLLCACGGAMMMVSGVNLFVAIGGLAAMALSCYTLVKFFRGEQGSDLAAGKYGWQTGLAFLAVVLSAVLLRGVFQTTNLGSIGAVVDGSLESGLAFGGLTTWRAWLALGLAASGAFLLMEAAPFQWFTAEIYEKTAAPAVAFVTVATKLAGLVLLLRAFSFVILFAQPKWIHVWGGVAILSMLWGNLAALRQNNVMRLLAYGSIGHAGFIMLGLVAANETSFSGMVYTIGAYVFATAGAFGMLIILRDRGAACASLADLNGLNQRSPVAAWLLVFFLIALAGVPPTAGFVGRYYLVKGLLAVPHPELAAFAVINALLAVCAYGRVAAHAFKKAASSEATPAGDAAAVTFSNGQTVALTAALFVSLAAGLYPAPFLRMATYVFGQ